MIPRSPLTKAESLAHYDIVESEILNYLRAIFWPPARGIMGEIVRDADNVEIGHWYEIQILLIYFRIRIYNQGCPYISLSLNFSRLVDDRGCENARAHIFLCFKIINLIFTIGVLTPRFDKSHKFVIDILNKRNQGEQNG